MKRKIYIIGIGGEGYDGLSQKARDIIRDAEIIIGGDRHLSGCRNSNAERIAIKGRIDDIADIIRENYNKGNRVVVVASGDPLFYGIGKHLLVSSDVPKDSFEIMPAVSSMQIAFARIKESWENATLISAHGRSMDNIIKSASSSDKIAIFTDNENRPDRIAKALIERGISNFKVYVCEDLGGSNERITEADLANIIDKSFSPLNILILIRKVDNSSEREISETAANLIKRRWSIGIPDDEFCHQSYKDGFITKSEIRVIALSKMKIKDDTIIWDIGAGSGSVSIEAAMIARYGKVYAVEKDKEEIRLIERNIQKFGIDNIRIIEGTAPFCLDMIEDSPDVIFIGGSGGMIEEIINYSTDRLKKGGKIVINIVTLRNLTAALAILEKNGFHSDILLVNIARTKGLNEIKMFESLNPIFIITAFPLSLSPCGRGSG
ncbi:MAG: precorrin-6y C5,15-methyltransferase (decarboxylating) subunit CbiE [Nitrospirota bacterium]